MTRNRMVKFFVGDLNYVFFWLYLYIVYIDSVVSFRDGISINQQNNNNQSFLLIIIYQHYLLTIYLHSVLAIRQPYFH